MKKIVYSSKAKKDIKRFQNDSKRLKELTEVLTQLACGLQLPERYKVHELLGEYKGCLECHIEGDFLLIWMDDDCLKIVRVGSHSTLFK